LVLGSLAEFAEQLALQRVGLAVRNPPIEPSRLFFVVPAVEAVTHERGLPFTTVVVFPVFILVFVLVPIVILVVVFFFLVLFVPVFVLVLVFIRPAFRLLGQFEVELMPLFEIEFLDLAVEIFDLDDLGIFIDGQDTKGLFLFDILVPLALDGFVVSAHGNHLGAEEVDLGCGFYFDSQL
jgi:predicted membrane metal-binding protein